MRYADELCMSVTSNVCEKLVVGAITESVNAWQGAS